VNNINDDEIQYPDTPFPLHESLVLLGRRGSESHGTFVPSTDPDSIDDRDLMGVCIPPAPWLLGVRQWEGAESIKGVWDVVLYDYRKFVRLLTKQNPNVIGMLWLEPEDYLQVGPAGQTLIDQRLALRCRDAAYESFSGYAYSQLKKMNGGVFRGYMGDKRKKLVERIGYDAKNAAHLVRLLHMGSEYQRTGELQVRRTWDREMLVEIKTGKWPLEKVKAYAESKFADMRAAYNESVLPEACNKFVIEQVLMSALLPRCRQ
jgi:uncharacterized protein